MRPTIKTNEEIELMRKGGQILAQTLDLIVKEAKPGISTLKLDQIAEEYIRSYNAIPSFKGYQGFPATLCTARNEVIVHGIPKKDDILQEGDLFTIDCGVNYHGLHTDAARSMAIGQVSPIKNQLLDTAKLVLKKAIKIAKPGIKVNQIGKIIEKNVKKQGFHIIYDLTGHGIGKNLHEAPTIYNYYTKKQKTRLLPGMTIAIEPIFSATCHEMITQKDNWTLTTKDNSPAVQEENTILITQSGNEVLTKIK